MMSRIGTRKFLAVFMTLAFLLVSVGFVDAKSGGSSSFSGSSGRSSVSSGSSKSFSSTPSGSGFKSSATKSSPSPSPSTSASKPDSSTSKSFFGFSNSKGNDAPKDTPKTGSAFSGSVNKGMADQKSNTPSTPNSQPRTYSAPATGSYSGGGSNTTVTRERTVIIRERPSGWVPSYYSGGGAYAYADLAWKLEMLHEIHDANERARIYRDLQSDPNYYKWKAEAEQNKELKAQLAKAESDLQEAKQVQSDDASDIKPVKKKSHTLFWIIVLIMAGGIGYLVYRKMR